MRPPRIIAGVLLALFVALCLGSMAQQSVTGDEVAHLPSGYTYVKVGDFRLNMQHPPLIKAMAGIPLLFLDLKPVVDGPGWAEGDEWEFGRDFLTNNRTSTWTIVFLARLPPLLVGLLLCVFVYFWARELWGEWPGVFVLALCVFCPNVLAHSPLVTTDTGLATFSVMSLYYLWRYSRSGRTREIAWCGVGLGLALLAKYSAVITVAAVFVLLPVAWWGGRSRESGVGSRELGALVGGALLLIVIPALLITLGFGFPHGLENYWRGFSIIHADLNPFWQGFLWGEYAREGFWYYYLLAQWWKTPIPTLLFFFVALFLVPLPWLRRGGGDGGAVIGGGAAADGAAVEGAAMDGAAVEGAAVDGAAVEGAAMDDMDGVDGMDGRRSGVGFVDWLFLLVPLAAFHGAGLLYKSSIGVRHVLPAFPFLFLVAGATAVWVAGQRGMHRLVFAVLLGWLAAGTLRVYPHFIPYFNAFAGGPDGGIEYLDDSNIEWGQDFDNLKRYIDERKLTKVRLSAFKAFRPERYGITYEFMTLIDVVWPQEGFTYFAGASYLQRNSLFNEHRGVRFEWLDRYRPAEKIGWSIFVYRFSTDEADRDKRGVVFVPRERWYSDAIEQLTRILNGAPKFAEAQNVLARVHAHRAAWREERGETEQAAIDWFRAARLNPVDAEVRRAFRQARDRLQAQPADEPGEHAMRYYLDAFVADQGQDADAAMRDYLHCLRLAPDHLGALYNLGQLYVRSGLAEMAAEMWQRCLEVQPGYPPAAQSLARLRQALQGARR